GRPARGGPDVRQLVVEQSQPRLLVTSDEAGGCFGGESRDPEGVALTDVVSASRDRQSLARERANRFRQRESRFPRRVLGILLAGQTVIDEGTERVEQYELGLSGDLLDRGERGAACEHGE